MSKALHKTLQAKMAALQGPEWDSSDEEGVASPVITEKKSKKKSVEKTAKQEKKPRSKVDPIKLGKKQQPKADDVDEEDEEDLVMYIGHLPKEFEEKDLIKFLSQFGKVYNCRIARKLQTGNSKGYAFVRFGDSEVAKIVCDTLHGYFIGQQRLVCQLRPGHKGMFFNTDSLIAKRRLQQKIEKKKRNQNLASLDKLKQITAQLVSREQKKRKQLEAMGIDYDFPGYEKNNAEYQEHLAGQESQEGASRIRSDSAGIESSVNKKKKRKDSVDSEGSAKKKKKRKNSVDGEAEETRERSLSVESEGSSTKSKRKGSVESEISAKKHKTKRKDSVDSEGSAKKKRKHSDASEVSTETPKKSNTSTERQTKTAVKKDKKKKDKKRRESAP